MSVKLRKDKKNKSKDFEVFDDSFQYLKSVRKKRTCLMCGKIFNSKSSSNRRCLKCQRLANARVEGSVSDFLTYRIVYDGPHSIL